MLQSIFTVEIDSTGIMWNRFIIYPDQYHHLIKTYKIIDLLTLLIIQLQYAPCQISHLPRRFPPSPSTRYCNSHRFAAWSTCGSFHNLQQPWLLWVMSTFPVWETPRVKHQGLTMPCYGCFLTKDLKKKQRPYQN